MDFNASFQGERVIDDDKLSALIEIISRHRLGLKDVEPDILGRAYEYLIRKFAEGQGQTAGEIYTPREVAWIMAYAVDPKEGEEVYDPCCGSGGLLIKCQLTLIEKAGGKEKVKKPLRIYGQELGHTTFAMAKMNTIIHDMHGELAIGDTLRNPKFLDNSHLKRFDIVVANPMWNQDGYNHEFYDSDPYERFKFGYPPAGTADWGWVQHMFASLNDKGRAAIVLDTGAVSRGSGGKGTKREKEIRAKFIENDWIEGILLLPDNLFYNTTASGIVLFLNKAKQPSRKGQIILINASLDFNKGQPKNFITEPGINRITRAFLNWEVEDKFSNVITLEEAKQFDYDLLPSRHVDIGETGTHRPITHILYDLEGMEREAERVDKELKSILNELGLNSEAYDI